jgi:hypothetical protein
LTRLFFGWNSCYDLCDTKRGTKKAEHRDGVHKY